MPVLYGSPISPYVRKVAIVLEEKQQAYEWIYVRPHDPLEAFRSCSPLGKIPAYRDEHIAIADSSVICQYLEKAVPENVLYPETPVPFAWSLWFEEYFDSALYPPMFTLFNERFMRPMIRGLDTDHAKITEAETELPPLLAYLEAQLHGEWMVADRFTIADIALGLGFGNLEQIGWQLQARDYPKLTAYIARIQARPSFIKTTDALIEMMNRFRKPT